MSNRVLNIAGVLIGGVVVLLLLQGLGGCAQINKETLAGVMDPMTKFMKDNNARANLTAHDPGVAFVLKTEQTAEARAVGVNLSGSTHEGETLVEILRAVMEFQNHTLKLAAEQNDESATEDDG